MCGMPKPKPAPGPSAPPPAPQPVADRIDPKRAKNPLDGARSGRSALTIQRSVGGLDTGGSGLVIGRP